jgi:hypothetical protein
VLVYVSHLDTLKRYTVTNVLDDAVPRKGSSEVASKTISQAGLRLY